jgi:hypothetical protein
MINAQDVARLSVFLLSMRHVVFIIMDLTGITSIRERRIPVPHSSVQRFKVSGKFDWARQALRGR